MKTVLALLLTSVIFAVASQAGLAEQGERRVDDLKSQLAGTSWKADSGASLRPGLAAELTFTDESVQPAGYRYDIGSNEELTITFNHGDTQKMMLAPDGRHLRCLFRGKQFTYTLFERRDSGATDELTGSTWKALPAGHTHPGLVGTISFSKDTVSPQGYLYEVNSDNSITIHFNHGGTFLMLLAHDGRRLSGLFNHQKYEYERVAN